MPATPPLTKCLACGGAIVRETRRRRLEYRGQAITYDQPGWWCVKCGEGYFDDADMDARDMALADVKAEVEGVLKPAEVRRIREKAGLSQRAAGRVLGGGVNAFQKYESGSATVSDAMANLLRAIDKHPAVLRTLCKAKGVAPAARQRAARRKRSA
jgi:HTH-type transcriptional regulator/antitoxin MqsA